VRSWIEREVSRAGWGSARLTKVEDTLSNLGQGANAAEPDVVDPSPGVGDGGEQRLFAIDSAHGCTAL
jgi:hypothetical protein